MKRFSAYLGAALAVFVLMLSTNVTSVMAAEASSGLSINPRKNYLIEPGKTVTDKLTIGNLDSKKDLNISLRLVDFTFTDETGTPKLLLAANAPQTTWSLKPFVKLPSEPITIQAGKSKTIEYTIKVPANQGAGSYYSAIEYAATGAGGGNVSLNASGVTLAFLSVPGVVREDMSLQKFGTFLPDPEGVGGKFQFISTNSVPTQMAFSLKNNGNVAENPAGSIVIKNMFGKVFTTIQKANLNDSLALIGQTRRFQTCITPAVNKVEFNGESVDSKNCVKPKMLPGRYTANLDVFYGQNGNQTHEIVGSASFWYLPWWFIVAVAVVVLVIAFYVRKLVRKLQGKSAKDNRRLSFRKNR